MFLEKVRKVEEGRRLRDRPFWKKRKNKNCKKMEERHKRRHRKEEKLVDVKSSVSDPYPDPHGSALNLSLGSAFRMRIRIQQLIKLAPKAKIIHII